MSCADKIDNLELNSDSDSESEFIAESSTESNDPNEFKNYLLNFDFVAARHFMLERSEYAIDEWFVVEDMMEVLFKIRNVSTLTSDYQQLLHDFYQAFVDAGQEDFFLYIDQFEPEDVSLEEAEMIDDLYSFMPPPVQGIFVNIVDPEKVR